MEALNFESAFEKIMSKARSDGAEVELLVERSEKFSVGFQKGRPEKFSSSTSHCAGLRVIMNGFEGISYSENLSDEALMSAYGEALSNAKFTAKAADPERKVKLFANASGEQAEIEGLYNDSLERISIEEKMERARLLEDVALKYDERIASVAYSGYNEMESEMQILTSTGVRRRDRRTGLSGYSYALAKQGDQIRMSGESIFLRNALEFNAEEIATKAARKAIAKLGAAPPETGYYPIVIDAEVASEIFDLFASNFSAQSVFEKTSLFTNDLGKAVASPKLHIVDDPFLRNGVGTRAFDSEGASAKRTTLVSDGRLLSFLTNSVYAERMKLPHTASALRSARSPLDIGISNMIVRPGEKTLEQLLAAYPKVIYITDFSGYHAGYKGSSGDFSLQSEGELWENGKRVRPLSDFVVAGNMRRLLEDIEDVSSRVLAPKSSVIAPDLLIRRLSVAGK